MEKILKVAEVQGIQISEFGGHYDGYKVTTSERNIFVLIDNFQNCCENWGYLTSEDNLEKFVGTTLIDVSVIDEACDSIRVKITENMLEYANTMFVNFQTSKGLLQLVAYNEHNGYYSHDVYLVNNNEIIKEEWL